MRYASYFQIPTPALKPRLQYSISKVTVVIELTLGGNVAEGMGEYPRKSLPFSVSAQSLNRDR
jgi:hypothetical protein